MNDENPMMYPPRADVIAPRSSHPSIPELLLNMRSDQDITRALRAAGVAGLLAAALLLVAALWQTWRHGFVLELGVGLLGAAVIAGLSYGVVRAHRLSSVALVVCYVAAQTYSWRSEGVMTSTTLSLIVAVPLLFFMVRGVQATWTYHRMERRFDAWQRAMDRTLDPRLFERDEERSTPP